jgi:hypothetical protein
MRTKFYSALLTLGLAAAALARAGHAGVPAPISPSMELVIDTSLRPTELHFTRPVQRNTIWNIADATDFGADDFTDLNLALSSPGLLFGMPYDFLSFFVRFGSAGAATTGVLFPNLSK